jgi:molybdopterin molybdotransferase
MNKGVPTANPEALTPKVQPPTANPQPLTLEQALRAVKEKFEEPGLSPPIESSPLEAARGRILAREVQADRDYPPFDRSMRDGFAVSSTDLRSIPARLECVGEAAAGGHYDQPVAAGTCVSIMTGAPLPAGTNAVAMVENTRTEGSSVNILQSVQAFDNVVRQGSEAAKESIVLHRGRKLRSAEIGLLASLGLTQVPVFRRPQVAIVATGDELVPIDRRPEWFQVRNSNAFSLASLVAEAGGIPRTMGIVPDRLQILKETIEQALKDELLVLSGGVSAGKYDLVEQALAELGAEFFFQSVALRPGRPLVFGRVRDRFFFGLPGNPVSSYVTFELFVRRAIEVLSGAGFEEPVFPGARLKKSVTPKKGLTAFVPARVAMKDGDPVVDLVQWQGSGDLVGLSAANCFLVLRPDQGGLQAGDWAPILPLAD